MIAPSKKRRLKVLITEGSSASARETIYTLGHQYDIGILDADPVCLCRFSRLVKRFHRCPHYASAPAEYLRSLVDTVRSESYDVVVPTHDQVYLLARVADVFGEGLRQHVGIALPDFAALRRMQGKADFIRTLQELNIPVPPTRIVRSLRELGSSVEFPCYFKLPYGTAGMGVRRVTNWEELRRVASEFEQSPQHGHAPEILVQQPAKGTMCTAQAIFQEGRMIAAHCAESLSRSVRGQGFRVSVSHPTVIEHVRRLGQHLRWHGAIFLEYVYDPASRQPQFIECNPRIGEPVNAMLCGVNLGELLVRISLGEKLEPLETTSANYPTEVLPPKILPKSRSHIDFLLLVADAVAGANRRRIVSQAWRMVTGTGAYKESFSEITRPSDDWLSLIPAVYTFLQILVWPQLARRLTQNVVDNYSLPQYGVDNVERLTAETLKACLEVV